MSGYSPKEIEAIKGAIAAAGLPVPADFELQMLSAPRITGASLKQSAERMLLVRAQQAEVLRAASKVLEELEDWQALGAVGDALTGVEFDIRRAQASVEGVRSQWQNRSTPLVDEKFDQVADFWERLGGKVDQGKKFEAFFNACGRPVFAKKRCWNDSMFRRLSAKWMKAKGTVGTRGPRLRTH